MATEFQINDISTIADIELLIKATGQNEKGERFVLYMTELHGRPMGGVIRLEDAEGNGFEVGRVGMTVSSFSRPIVSLTTFNSCKKLTGKFLMLAADTDALWVIRRELERAEYEASQQA